MFYKKLHFIISNKFTKKNFFTLLLIIFLTSLLLFSNSNIYAVKEGLKLWVNKVIPSLFPFFIATELLYYTNIPHFIGKIFSPIMKHLFNLPGSIAYAFILGIISGYPVGAKIISDLYSKKLCTKSEAENALAFSNNSGPLFILGTIGSIMYQNSIIGLLLLFTHILSAITIGIIISFLNKENEEHKSIKQEYKNSYSKESNDINIGEILSNSILNSIKTILLIGGFIVLFSVIISILESFKVFDILQIPFNCFKQFGLNPQYINGFFSGLIELTNGLSIISNIPAKAISINIIISSFLLGFGGLSVFLQVYSICYKNNLSMKKYLIFKIFQGIIAAIYTYLLINSFSFLNFNL